MPSIIASGTVPTGKGVVVPGALGVAGPPTGDGTAGLLLIVVWFILSREVTYL